MADRNPHWTAEDRRTELRLRQLIDDLIAAITDIRRELAVQGVALAQLRVEMNDIKRRS